MILSQSKRTAMLSLKQLIRCSAALVLMGSLDVSLAAPKPADTGDDNLGDALLEEGLGDLFPELRSKKEREAQGERDRSTRPTPDRNIVPSDETLRRLMEESAGSSGRGQTPPGEDVGDRQNPLSKIAQRMDDAGLMVGDGRIETIALPIQKQVVADLDRLIAEMEKQSSSSSSSSQQQKQQKQSQRSDSKPAGGQPSGGKPQASASQQAAMQAPGRPQGGEAEPPPTSGPIGADALKAAWGHLPQRVREQMLQSSADEFLPEYREAIEAYYRRLAEDREE